MVSRLRRSEQETKVIFPSGFPRKTPQLGSATHYTPLFDLSLFYYLCRLNNAIKDCFLCELHVVMRIKWNKCVDGINLIREMEGIAEVVQTRMIRK